MILAGGGIRAGRTVESFREARRSLGVPVVNSLMGVDALPFEHPLRVGLIGTYGNRWANIALSRCDALLVLGSRLDIRQTGADTDTFAAGRTIHHVDCDPGEVNNRVTGCHALIAQLSAATTALSRAAGEYPSGSHEDWRQEIGELAQRWPDTGELVGIEGINPNLLMHQISGQRAAVAYVADVGQHQMWAAQSLELERRSAVSNLRRDGRDGFRLADGRWGGGGGRRPDRADRGRRRFPAQYSGVADHCPQRSPGQDGGPQQRLPWHGSPVSGVVLRSPLPVHLVGLFGPGIRGGRGCLRDPRTSGWRSRPTSRVRSRRCGRPMAHTGRGRDRHDANAYPKIAFGHPISEMEPFVAPKAMERHQSWRRSGGGAEEDRDPAPASATFADSA